jgi:DNA gyrase subunit A
MTANGYIKRTSASEYAAQGKGGMGKKGMATREEDYVNTVFTASTHDYILFFTDKGRVFRKKGYEIPEAGRTARGTNIVNVLQVEQSEKVAVMIHTRDISERDEPCYLTMFTRRGTVKRLDAAALKNLRNNGLRVIILEEGDELIEVRETDGEQNLLIATHNGMAVCFPEDKIRPTGRNSMGVIGIRLREGDYVVAAARAKPGKAVLTITENGYGKRSPVEDYRITDRGAYGIKNYGLTEKTGPVVGVKVVDGSEDLLLVTQSGTLIRTDVDEIRTCGRASQGVIVMRFKEEGDRVIAMSLAEKEEAPPAEEDSPLEGDTSDGE